MVVGKVAAKPVAGTYVADMQVAVAPKPNFLVAAVEVEQQCQSLLACTCEPTRLVHHDSCCMVADDKLDDLVLCI